MRKKLLIALPSLLFSLLFFLYTFNLGTLLCKPPSLTTSSIALTLAPPPRPQTNLSILLGILTRPDNYERRHFLRLVYGVQPSHTAQIDVKFVFCNLTKPEQIAFVSLEILRFNDIIILNCTENMNQGKTYTYLSSIPRILPRRYDYVMKADDDVFFRLEPLALSIHPLPRQDTYYGFVIPCNSNNPFVEYMSGMGYALSWDLVEWIATSPIPASETVGPEDKLVGRWLNVGKKGANRFSVKPGMYDYPGANGKCSHELIPETVAVHRLKRWDQWLRVLRFFNVTSRLEESALYHF